MKKTYRIKTNNQELLIRKQNESDATSRWIEFQKTRPWREISSWRKKEEREDLKKLELIKKAQILREVNHAFKKSNENNEWSMEDWMLLGRLVPWQSMVNHSWL